MRKNPNAELLAKMADFRLFPRKIIWNGNVHRFPGVRQNGRGTNGWYCAQPHQRSASFGDWNAVETQRWTLEDVDDNLTPEKERQKREAARWAKADHERSQRRQEAIRKAWKLAEGSKIPDDHPYLKTKGIKAPPHSGRVIGEDIVIPMWWPNGCLVGLQRIRPDGFKPYDAGSKPAGAYETVGPMRIDPKKPIYVCGDWGTGVSIYEATGCAVAVAFSAGNLEPVAVAMRTKRPNAKVVIAADNDRWTSTHFDGKRRPNPGVLHAKAAAAAANAEYAIPDFKDLSDIPEGEKLATSFNDLHQREGLDAVRKWLNPQMADKAVTELVSEHEEKAPEEEEPTDGNGGPATWDKEFATRFLGIKDGNHHFLSSTGQLVSLTNGQMANASKLVSLAPLGFWQRHFPSRSKNSVRWIEVADALQAKSQAAGVWSPERIRGRGYWRGTNGSDVVIHLGQRLIAPNRKRPMAPEKYGGGGHVYPRAVPLSGPSTKRILSLDDARWLLGIFEDLPWEHPASAYLLAGWTVLAPLCGWLRWRPHVWLTGDAGCGKTSIIIRDLVRPLMADFAIYAEGSQTTEAGLRQALRVEARPVLLDKFEKDKPSDVRRIKRIVRMLRSASASEGIIIKGGPGGKAELFQPRTMCCLGSIGGAVTAQRDKQRISFLQLRHPQTVLGEGQEEHWDGIKEQLDKITPAFASELLARTTRWARSGKLDELLKVSRTVAMKVVGDGRGGDQFGTLMAGAAILLHDEVPKIDEMRTWMNDLGIKEFWEADGGQQIIDQLFQAKELVGTGRETVRVTIADLLLAALRPSADNQVTVEVARQHLRSCGFVLTEDEQHLLIANQSPWISEQLRHISCHTGWYSRLRTLPGAEVGPPRRFPDTTMSRTTKIPVTTLQSSGSLS